MTDESARWDGDDSGKLDILVRTSNVKRLSDFMMWQVSPVDPRSVNPDGTGE